MLKKIILSLIFVIGAQDVACSDYINGLYGSNWDFMEDVFIVKPKKRYSRISNLLVSGALSAGGYKLGESLYTYYIKEYCSDSYILNKDLYKKRALKVGVITSLVSGAGFYKLLADNQENNIDYDALKKFVIFWHENKAYTPKEFHQSFDSLSFIYKNNRSAFDENYQDAIRLIRKAIYKKFPNKYKTEDSASDKKGFWNSKVLLGHVDFSFSGTLNSIANLIRAISGR